MKEIFEEVARGLNLDRALSLIADQVAVDLGAPTCKIWVVKRGDICDRCPLAGICTNRQMCMHLAATSGAAIDKEYSRIPLSVFNASLIARGGTESFNDPNGAGEKLFGLQHGAQGESRDSYALYPLRSGSSTVGLIGVFNHRPIEGSELSALARFAPAAVAAIRVAELQSRYDLVRRRLEKEAAAASLGRSASERNKELEDAVAQLTRQVAQLQVEREQLVRTSEQSDARALELEDENRSLRDRADSLVAKQQESGRAYSEMAAQLESARRQVEEENSWLKGRVATLEQNSAELGKLREEVPKRNGEIESLKAELEAGQSELQSAHETMAKLEARVGQLEETNAELREHNTAIADSLDDLERSLRIAEDARARLEQARVSLEERARDVADEMERLRAENGRVGGENEQLVAEIERLRGEMNEMQATSESLGEDVVRLTALNNELEEARSNAEARVAEYEQEIATLLQSNAQLEETINGLNEENSRLTTLNNEITEGRANAEERLSALEQEYAALTEANAQLENAIKQFESLTARLEESAAKLGDRADASELARADLEQRNRTLAEQNRRLTREARAKAKFLASMSHELRTPLNAIIGFTSLLLEDRSLRMTGRQHRNLERVSRNARDLLEFINNLLDLSKIEAGRMDVYSEPAHLRDLVERALDVVEPLKEGRPVRLTLEVDDRLPVLRTDRTKLQQILINLLSNAIKFTPEGEVKVTAEQADADRIRIQVADTGVGIAESDIPKLFEEFRQVGSPARATRSGTGLGLAITRRLVELLGGEITVSSRLDEGSTFQVTLPIEIEGRQAAAQQVEAADPDRTALVIDGDPASLYLTKKYLTEAGYSVAATDDPARGVEIARLAKPMVITIDLDLAEDALNIIEQIALSVKSANGDRANKVIAISSETATEQGAINAGADTFLRKPVERDDLLRVVERAGRDSAGRVLVVDDDKDAVDLVVAMLEESGYEIQTAASGRQALDSVARSRPDVMILDLMMPEMDGFEVLHRLSLKPDLREIPVILITAHDISHEERRAFDIGTTRVIQKGSFSRDELLAEIEAVAPRKERSNAVSPAEQ